MTMDTNECCTIACTCIQVQWWRAEAREPSEGKEGDIFSRKGCKLVQIFLAKVKQAS